MWVKVFTIILYIENLMTDRTNIKVRDTVRLFILIYWTLFWLLNVIDKIIGGAHLLFVGRDRFAQVERFFDSIGLDEPIYANLALILTAGLETFALVFFLGALYFFITKSRELAGSWFLYGIGFTLTTFTFFSIGDQVFGDHFELLEHGLFWFIALLSWMTFAHLDHISFPILSRVGAKYRNAFLSFTSLLVFATSASIYYHNHTSFVERNQAVSATQITENTYKIQFPFLAGSTAFEKSLEKFLGEHPRLQVDNIYTAPNSLRLGKSDGLIIYIQTAVKQ